MSKQFSDWYRSYVTHPACGVFVRSDMEAAFEAGRQEKAMSEEAQVDDWLGTFECYAKSADKDGSYWESEDGKRSHTTREHFEALKSYIADMQARLSATEQVEDALVVAKNMHTTAHRVSPFMTAETGEGKYRITMSFNRINDMHDLHRAMADFFSLPRSALDLTRKTDG